MSHYFDLDPTLDSRERKIEFTIKGRNISLLTDNGIFSKSKLDEGSELLINTILPLQLGENILDIGCGYGPIGLSIALFNEQASVTLADINPRAVTLCEKNAHILGIETRIKCKESNLYSNILETFDVIVANPPIRAGKKITYPLYEGAYQHLNNGGYFYFVIRKAQGASSASQYVKEIFGNITLLKRHKGYHIYMARK